MKLMVVAPYFFPKIGGMEKYAYNISRGLKEKYNWEIVVITSNHLGKKYTEEIVDGTKIYRLASWFHISNTPINPLWYFQIKKIIKKESPDIINVHSPVVFISDITSLVAGKIPLVTTFHSGSMIKTAGALNALIGFYEKYLLPSLFKRSNKIICSSGYIKKRLSRYEDKTIDIPPGVDVSVFRPSPREPINDVLFVGRIETSSDWKGIRYLLEAVSIIKVHKPDISLRLVGSGDMVDYYREYANKLKIGDNVVFAGPKTGNDLVHEYQECKLLVLPSITESESFGIVLIEAMACKKPVIGSNVGGIPYVIDNKVDGLLVQPKNPADLAKAIMEILNDPLLSRKMGECGYNKVKENYTLGKQIEITKKYFEK